MKLIKTIRGKIAVLFVILLSFIGIITAFYYKNIFALEDKLAVIQNFDDFRDNILELRRYEKNFVYFKDIEDMNQSTYYLFKTEDSFHSLAEDIVRVIGPQNYRQFKEALYSYKSILGENMARVKSGEDAVDVEGIRSKGKQLVDFTNNLIAAKRHRIEKTLQRTLTIPLAFLGSFVVFIVLIFKLVNHGILKPLALLQRATEEAAKGTFTPIVYSSEQETEVDRLIEAFNEMAKRLETKQEQLLQSRKMASIGTLTSGIAHELNNPINNISLSAESVLELGPEISYAEAKEMIEDILFQADRASQVVKDLLEFSRTERPFLLKLSIKETLERTIKLIKNQIMVTGIQIEKDIPGDLPPIKGRRQDLQQAFINILLNAIQAMQDISKENVIAIGAGLGPENYIRVDITDTGCGIKPGDIDHIFDPFFTTKEVGRGTGLGLSLVYSIIRTHGGYVEVQSKINQGTTFSIFLPTVIKNNKDSEYNV